MTAGHALDLAAPPRRLAHVRRLGAPQPGFAGAGHTAIEVIAPAELTATDPFVLLMDDRVDFPSGRRIGGPHPHAGLETVTFVLDGVLVDRDEGVLEPGHVAWMTAGRGVVHNEHVTLRSGPARVLQLWLTLPERGRAAAPRVQIVRGSELPVYREAGVEARLYSGNTHGLTSPTRNHVPATIIDLRLARGASFTHRLPASFNGFVLPIEGAVHVGGSGPVSAGEIGWLERAAGDHDADLPIAAEGAPSRVLLYAAERQEEPTIQQGPFVAGSRAAIEQMYRDYRAGRFTPLSELPASARAR